MKLSEAKSWAENKSGEGHKSDGCTFAPDRMFHSLKECCMMHDFLVRFEKVPRKDADLLMRECIENKSNRFVGFIYYTAVRVQAKLGFGGIMFIGFLLILSLLIHYV